MHIKNKSFYLIILLLLLLLPEVKAQFRIFSKNSLEKIKDGNTHIIVGNIHFPRSEEFLTIFKKYWTLTKSVDFISVNDLRGNLVAGDSYFSMETFVVHHESQGGDGIFMYLNLWVPKARAVQKDREFKIQDEISIAHIQLSADMQTLKDLYTSGRLREYGSKEKDFDNGFDFDGGAHVFDWNPGFLKNYLQQLSRLLQISKTADFTDDFTNKDQLHLLQNKILYFPEDAIKEVGNFIRPKKEIIDTAKVFEDYKFKYKIITNEELEEKILADHEPFYYVSFLRNNASKMVAVVNSRTGEIIYSRYTGMAYLRLKAGDLKDLSKEIK